MGMHFLLAQEALPQDSIGECIGNVKGLFGSRIGGGTNRKRSFIRSLMSQLSECDELGKLLKAFHIDALRF